MVVSLSLWLGLIPFGRERNRWEPFRQLVISELDGLTGHWLAPCAASMCCAWPNFLG